MKPFIGDTFSDSEFGEIIEKAYAGFGHDARAPLVQLGPNHHLLELFHGVLPDGCFGKLAFFVGFSIIAEIFLHKVKIVKNRVSSKREVCKTLVKFLIAKVKHLTVIR